MRKALIIAIAALAAVAGGVIATRHDSRDNAARTQRHAKRADLEAALPPQLPVSLLPQISDSEIHESGTKTTITVRLAHAEGDDDRVTILVLADELRNRGWNVTPTSDAGHRTISGYGWTGDLRTVPSDGGVVVELRSGS